MGGFGAVKLGLKHPRLFASVHSHSGVFGLLRDPAESKRLSPEFTRIFGKDPKDGPEDPYHLAGAADPKRLSSLRLDCGDEDPFLEQNRAFHEHLRTLDIPHEYHEPPGSHSWGYWDQQVRQALDFHRRNLNIPDDPEHEILR
jgi:S-formylglutathione hydrolase FrmB